MRDGGMHLDISLTFIIRLFSSVKAEQFIYFLLMFRCGLIFLCKSGEEQHFFTDLPS